MLILVGILLAILVLGAVWITQLRRLVEQRTTQLQMEIHEREQAEQQRALEVERSRIARDLHDDLHHRHVSHLYPLYPGDQITTLGSAELKDAAKKSLEICGDDGTGWSIAWKENLWARLRDGDHAQQLLSGQLRFTVPGVGQSAPRALSQFSVAVSASRYSFWERWFGVSAVVVLAVMSVMFKWGKFSGLAGSHPSRPEKFLGKLEKRLTIPPIEFP